MPILGIHSTESFSAERFTNIRQKVFYFYPNGAAPLTGLLSLMKQEELNDPEFTHYEKRLSEQRDTTASQGGAIGPFKNAADSASMGDPFNWVADTVHTVYVASNSLFRVGHQVKIPVTTGGTALTDLLGIVTENPTVTGAGKLRVRALNTVNNVDNGAGGAGENTAREVWIVGSAFQQGSLDVSQEVYNLPISLGNFAQIFRTPFSFTGTALKTSAKFDEAGPYKDKAKEHSVYHMIEMEKAFIFGKKHKFVSGGLPTYTTNGILEYLKLWEAGATYGNSAATLDADDNKRIITNSAGTMNVKLYDSYMERLFRVTNNTANEKLCLCGSGFLSIINQMYANKTMLTSRQGDKTTFGMTVVQHDTPYGTIYYKSHPLFSQNPTLRFNALFLDVPNLMYRHVSGRDTELLKNRQPNDADYRKDEWLTECGLELRFPESHMYLQNVRDFIP
jgi:hypothetical protein